MNNGTSDTIQPAGASRPPANRQSADADELSRTKRELTKSTVAVHVTTRVGNHGAFHSNE